VRVAEDEASNGDSLLGGRKDSPSKVRKDCWGKRVDLWRDVSENELSEGWVGDVADVVAWRREQSLKSASASWTRGKGRTERDREIGMYCRRPVKLGLHGRKRSISSPRAQIGNLPPQPFPTRPNLFARSLNSQYSTKLPPQPPTKPNTSSPATPPIQVPSHSSPSSQES